METVKDRYCDREVMLPAKLSDLILVALRDLARVERSRKYRVDMNVWHDRDPSDPKTCVVCLAGAVMAKTCGVAQHESARPSYFSDRICNRLRALDHLRTGDVFGAVYELEPTRAREFEQVDFEADFAAYDFDRKKFKAYVRKVAAFLAERGL